MLGPRARSSWQAQPIRTTALRLAVAALVLVLLVASAREFIGSQPTSTELVQIITSAKVQPKGQLEPLAAGWWETFGALGLFWEYLTGELQVSGAPWLLLTVFAVFFAWWLLALLGEWRRPPIILIALLLLQVWAAGWMALPLVPPSHRLQTNAKAFDFGVASSGVLSPQQLIEGHRARGYSGLVLLNGVLPSNELQTLSAANPDLTLLSGIEYRGAAQLLLVGVTTAISPQTQDVPAATKAAKNAGGLVFILPQSNGEYSIQQLLQLGANGLVLSSNTAWNREAQRWAKAGGRSVVSASIAESTPSNAWTLLPATTSSLDDVVRFVRSRQVAVALAPTASPQLPQAARLAWRKLSRAQRVNVVFGTAVIIALLVFWGAGAKDAAAAHGPQRAVGFLRRRRMGGRVLGLLLMTAAWLGTLFVVYAAVLDTSRKFAFWPDFPALYVVPIFTALALLYLYGRSQWRQVQ